MQNSWLQLDSNLEISSGSDIFKATDRDGGKKGLHMEKLQESGQSFGNYNGWVIRGYSPKECEIMETLPPFASK